MSLSGNFVKTWFWPRHILAWELPQAIEEIKSGFSNIAVTLDLVS